MFSNQKIMRQIADLLVEEGYIVVNTDTEITQRIEVKNSKPFSLGSASPVKLILHIEAIEDINPTRIGKNLPKDDVRDPKLQ